MITYYLLRHAFYQNILIPQTDFHKYGIFLFVLQWACLPLAGFCESDKKQYEVHVFTGNAKGAETSSEVSILITGTKGHSGEQKLKVKDDQVIIIRFKNMQSLSSI